MKYPFAVGASSDQWAGENDIMIEKSFRCRNLGNLTEEGMEGWGKPKTQ